MIFELIDMLHKKLPSEILLQYIKNVRAYYTYACTEFGEVNAGCACSGTGIWKHGADALLRYWKQE